MAAEHTCPTCGGPAEVNEDFLHCPDCNTPTGRRFKDLWVSLRTRSRLAEAAGDTTLVALRYLVRERFGGWDAEALDRLAGWLVAKHRLTVDQVYVASFETLRGLLEQRAAENDDAPPKTEHQGGQGGIAPAGVDVSAIRDALSELQMAILSVEPVADGDGFDEADRFAWQSIIDSRDRLKAAIDSTEHLAAAIRPADLRRLAELIEYVGAMYHLDTDSPEIGPAPDELCRRLQNMFSIFPVPARQTRPPAAAARAATSDDGGTPPADGAEDDEQSHLTGETAGGRSLSAAEIAMKLFECGCERLELDAAKRGASREVFNWLIGKQTGSTLRFGGDFEWPEDIKKPAWFVDENYATFSDYLTRARKASGSPIYDLRSGIETPSVKHYTSLDGQGHDGQLSDD